MSLGAEVAEALDGGQQPERRASQLFGCSFGDRSVLGGPDQPDGEPGVG